VAGITYVELSVYGVGRSKTCFYWPLRAARELGQAISWLIQYLRAAPEGSQARVPVDLENLKSCFEEQHAVPQG
jgi:hypothetical protein